METIDVTPWLVMGGLLLAFALVVAIDRWIRARANKQVEKSWHVLRGHQQLEVLREDLLPGDRILDRLTKADDDPKQLLWVARGGEQLWVDKPQKGDYPISLREEEKDPRQGPVIEAIDIGSEKPVIVHRKTVYKPRPEETSSDSPEEGETPASSGTVDVPAIHIVSKAAA